MERHFAIDILGSLISDVCINFGSNIMSLNYEYHIIEGPFLHRMALALLVSFVRQRPKLNSIQCRSSHVVKKWTGWDLNPRPQQLSLKTALSLILHFPRTMFYKGSLGHGPFAFF
jgi:hypothetical protein